MGYLETVIYWERKRIKLNLIQLSIMVPVYIIMAFLKIKGFNFFILPFAIFYLVILNTFFTVFELTELYFIKKTIFNSIIKFREYCFVGYIILSIVITFLLFLGLLLRTLQ